MAPISQRVFSQRRAISCTPQQQGPANGNDKDAKTLEDDEEDEEDAENDGRWSDADFEEDGSLSLLSPEERLARRIVEEEGVGSGTPKKAERKIKYKPTFLNLGEETPFDIDGLSDDDDDITSLGYIELEQVREMRHYNRVAAWEMPLLASKLHLKRVRDCWGMSDGSNLLTKTRVCKTLRTSYSRYAVTLEIHLVHGRTTSRGKEGRIGVLPIGHSWLNGSATNEAAEACGCATEPRNRRRQDEL